MSFSSPDKIGYFTSNMQLSDFSSRWGAETDPKSPILHIL